MIAGTKVDEALGAIVGLPMLSIAAADGSELDDKQLKKELMEGVD